MPEIEGGSTGDPGFRVREQIHADTAAGNQGVYNVYVILNFNHRCGPQYYTYQEPHRAGGKGAMAPPNSKKVKFD